MSSKNLLVPAILIIILIISSWTWEIFSFNLILLILVCALSISLLFSIIKPSTKLNMFCVVIFITLVLWQGLITKNTSFKDINPTEEEMLNVKRVQISKINPYLGKFLQSRYAFMFYKFQENLLRSLDTNEYFFAGHPREIAGFREFEKFNFILLMPFIVGIFISIIKKYKQLLIGTVISHLFIGIIGANNGIGAFILYPFFVVFITLGLTKIFKIYV